MMDLDKFTQSHHRVGRTATTLKIRPKNQCQHDMRNSIEAVDVCSRILLLQWQFILYTSLNDGRQYS